MGLRKAAVLKLVTQAQELEAGVQRGRLTRDASGCWLLDQGELLSFLQKYEGHEIVIIAAALDDDRPATVRTCTRCGRDYTDSECPYCAETRHRLRPKW